MTRIWIALVLLLAACGGARDIRTSDMVEIDTYLATPARGSATDAAATRDCRSRGKRAIFRVTRGNGTGGYRHIYECLP